MFRPWRWPEEPILAYLCGREVERQSPCAGRVQRRQQIDFVKSTVRHGAPVRAPLSQGRRFDVRQRLEKRFYSAAESAFGWPVARNSFRSRSSSNSMAGYSRKLARFRSQAPIREYLGCEGAQDRIANVRIAAPNVRDRQIIRQMAWADDLDPVIKHEDANGR